MRHLGAMVCGLILVLCTVSASWAQSGRQEQLETSLDAFCQKWMGFLEQRQRDNKSKIVWRSDPVGVRGEFVGYHNKYSCNLSELRPETRVPVGTIKYLELKFQHRGSSTTEALDARPKVIEATEVTEIFRYSKNKWVY